MNLEQLYHSVKDGLLLLDKGGYILYANNSVTAITGYSSIELSRKHISIFADPIKKSFDSQYFLNEAGVKGRFEYEGWSYKKNGERIWCETVLTAISEADELKGYSFQFRDISEKKERELQLLKSEERFRLMVEGVRDYAIFLLDPKGYISTWNEGAMRTKGYSSYEIIGKHFSTFYTAEDLQDGKPERELIIAQQTGKYEEEGWRVKKNGSVFWANVVITALYNEQNKLIGFSKVTRDLSERKSNEEHLRQSEERYRLLVDQVTGYGIFMLDEKGRIISWNEGARRIKGYEYGEIVGKYFSIFYTEEDILRGKPKFELEKAKSEGRYEEEGWRLRKDGSMFWANVVITAVHNSAGILIGYSKVTRDLTEKKEAEMALKDSYERYRQLTEELRTTNEELSQLNEELEQFTSIVSHDLQEPVRTIKSFLQLSLIRLREGAYEQLPLYLEKSVAAASRMRELIQNLLHYTMLARTEPSRQKITIDELVTAVLQNMRTAIEESRAVITIESAVKEVEGDEVQLRQLLQNLLSNALKFNEGQQPIIKIRCWKEGDAVRFSVTDNGIGMEPSDKEKIFEIFKRLHTGNEYPGTGIGLAICKKIVDRHGGEIWPESEPGNGTTFHFTIQSKQPQT